MKRLSAVLFGTLVASVGLFANSTGPISCSISQANATSPGTFTVVGNQITGTGTLSVNCSSESITGAIDISSLSVILVGSFDGGTPGVPVTDTFTFNMPSTISPIGTVNWSNASAQVVASGNISANNTSTVNTTNGPYAGNTVGAFTITVPDTISGQVVDTTATAYVTYNYDVNSSTTPEPVSMLLFGSGLLAVSIIGRKKLIRK
jgi:hypothetical protein